MKINGEKVKKIRLSLGKSQEEFGQLFNPPASKSSVSRWEEGHGARKGRLKKIAKLAGVSVESLFPDLLTEQQKDCFYCHFEQGELGFEFTTHDGNKAALLKNPDGYYLGVWNTHHHKFIEEIDIDYCPKCGRPLNEEEKQ